MMPAFRSLQTRVDRRRIGFLPSRRCAVRRQRRSRNRGARGGCGVHKFQIPTHTKVTERKPEKVDAGRADPRANPCGHASKRRGVRQRTPGTGTPYVSTSRDLRVGQMFEPCCARRLQRPLARVGGLENFSNVCHALNCESNMVC